MAHKWQVAFCDGDFCAALLLNFFSYWHDIKCEQANKAIKSNEIAQNHGDDRLQDESLLQFHTVDDLSDGILGAFGRTKIMEAIALLKSKGVISTHPNPNPRYKFDKTTYYLFYPDICNQWLTTYKNNIGARHRTSVTLDSSEVSNRVLFSDIDSPDLDYRTSENRRPSSKNGCSSSENRQAITEITAEITNREAAVEYVTEPLSEKPAKNTAAFSLIDDDRVIGDALSKKQQHLIWQVAEEFLPRTRCNTVNELGQQICVTMLSSKSFKQAGMDFLHKLSIIKKMLREDRWTPPIDTFIEKKDAFKNVINEIDEKIHHQKMSIEHCERMLKASPAEPIWMKHLEMCNEQYNLLMQERKRMLIENKKED